jgi:hypothetical protein
MTKPIDRIALFRRNDFQAIMGLGYFPQKQLRFDSNYLRSSTISTISASSSCDFIIQGPFRNQRYIGWSCCKGRHKMFQTFTPGKEGSTMKQ